MQLTVRSIVTTELPFQSELPLDRWLLRSMLLVLRPLLMRAEHAEILSNLREPYIVALNHNHYLESLLIPAFLIWHRGGRPIRFMADWNFLLLPGIATLMRRARVIPVTRKPARPRFLTNARSWLVHGLHGYQLARRTIQSGCSVGVFPEGTINPDPVRMLRGHVGTARLSLETGAPVVPVGIRYPSRTDSPIRAWDKMVLSFGMPLRPTAHGRSLLRSEVLDWHAQIMMGIAGLANKEWPVSRKGGIDADATNSASRPCHNGGTTAPCSESASADILRREEVGG